MVNNEDFQASYTTVADQTAQYPIPFLYFFNPVNGLPELFVSLNGVELEYPTDYTVSSAGLQLTVAPEAGLTLVIANDPVFEQLTDFQVGIIDPEQIENSFDRAVMRDIYLRSQLERLATVAWTGSYNDLTDVPAGIVHVQSDWDQTDNTQPDFIKNKPTIPAAQIQADWSQSDNTKLDYIKNKPTNLVSTNTAQTISGLKTFTGDIVLSGTTSIENSTSGTNTTMLYKDISGIHVGSVTSAIALHGSSTRPTYNGNNLALFSDITAGTLPSQAGNSGKFLTTDGTDASWATINAIQNEATASTSIAIGGATATLGGAVSVGDTASAASQAVAIGSSATAKTNGVSIGYNSTAQGQGVAIGVDASLGTGATYSTAVGYAAQVFSKGAIQLGAGTNSTAGTFSVGLSTDSSVWHNYTLLGASGTIPAARMASVPASNGTFVLQLTVTSGVPTLSWVSYNSNSSSYTFPSD